MGENVVVEPELVGSQEPALDRELPYALPPTIIAQETLADPVVTGSIAVENISEPVAYSTQPLVENIYPEVISANPVAEIVTENVIVNPVVASQALFAVCAPQPIKAIPVHAATHVTLVSTPPAETIISETIVEPIVEPVVMQEVVTETVTQTVPTEITYDAPSNCVAQETVTVTDTAAFVEPVIVQEGAIVTEMEPVVLSQSQQYVSEADLVGAIPAQNVILISTPTDPELGGAAQGGLTKVKTKKGKKCC